MNVTPRQPMGLLHFTKIWGDDPTRGRSWSADVSSIKNLGKIEIGKDEIDCTAIVYWDGTSEYAKESFDELTSRYERIIRGKPSVEIEGDPRGEK